jgi:hypothetical protein
LTTISSDAFTSSNSEARSCSGFSRILLVVHYVVYLDEFGHIGAFKSRLDSKYKESPVFGLGGFLLPADKVRAFSSWFYQLKCHLLAWEIQQAQIPAFRWEKKGSALYTTKNIEKYSELRKATFRLLNRIEKDGGKIFYIGLEKTHSPETNDPKSLYTFILREAIKRLDQFCESQNASFLLILDHQDAGTDFREQIVAQASLQMFGEQRCPTMLEPPVQAESYLFQTLQCADWICGLVGRVASFEVQPVQYPDFDWTQKYFVTRLKRVSIRSGIRRRELEVMDLSL